MAPAAERASDYSSWKVTELKAELKRRGVPQTGLRLKQQIVDKLIELDSASGEEEEGASDEAVGQDQKAEERSEEQSEEEAENEESGQAERDERQRPADDANKAELEPSSTVAGQLTANAAESSKEVSGKECESVLRKSQPSTHEPTETTRSDQAATASPTPEPHDDSPSADAQPGAGSKTGTPEAVSQDALCDARSATTGAREPDHSTQAVPTQPPEPVSATSASANAAPDASVTASPVSEEKAALTAMHLNAVESGDAATSSASLQKTNASATQVRTGCEAAQETTGDRPSMSRKRRRSDDDASEVLIAEGTAKKVKRDAKSAEPDHSLAVHPSPAPVIAESGTDTEMKDLPAEPQKPDGTSEHPSASTAAPVVAGSNGQAREMRPPSPSRSHDQSMTQAGRSPADSLSPSPPPAASGPQVPEATAPASRHPPTRSLFISNLMRPLQPDALRRHLSSLAESCTTSAARSSDSTALLTDFYLDSIKSHCFVTLPDVATAQHIRAALHDVVWPDERMRKPLWIDFLPDDKVREFAETERAGDAGRSRGMARWEVIYSEDAHNGTVRVELQCAGAKAAAAPPRPRPAEAIPPPPTHRPARGFQALDDLFKSTTTKPRLYFMPVSRDVVYKRLDRFDRLASKAASASTRGTGATAALFRGADELRRYTFEDGDSWACAGPLGPHIGERPLHGTGAGGGMYRRGRGGRLGGDFYRGRGW
ncbi:hypothetical protein KEM52_005065 [Ascosphaera acerosa]|nr:hypothetical protein KEM52_005065 [Ascosphaera acerosa]